MGESPFDAATMAEWYARRHLEVDPGTAVVYHLRSPDPREIRFVEVNTMMAERDVDPFVPSGPVGAPFDPGAPTGPDGSHSLLIVDVTPGQFTRLERGQDVLLSGWSLADPVAVLRRPPA